MTEVSPVRPCFTLSISTYWNDIKSDNIMEHNTKFFKGLHISRNSQLYKLVGYKPALSSMMTDEEISNMGFFKSVLFDEKNKCLCYSPPKAMTFDFFKKKYKEKTDYIIAEEWVEGMMINVFYDENVGFGGSWEIVTRDKLYGVENMHISNGTKKKISACFKEACDACGLNVNVLDKRLCYSFVMQHPDDIYVVTPFKEMRIYLIEMYEIVNGIEGSTVCVYPYYKYEHMASSWLAQSRVKLPSVITWGSNSFDDLKNMYSSSNMPYYIKGVVLRDELSGLRTQIKNVNYDIAKNHYGKVLEMQYMYLKLRKERKVDDFLAHFPSYKSYFDDFDKIRYTWIQSLFTNYVTSFIKKEKKLKDFESLLMRNHLVEIHNMYKTLYKPEKKYITYTIVANYVNHLEPYLLMLFMNEAVLENKKDWGAKES
jgi:hypothetical protein